MVARYTRVIVTGCLVFMHEQFYSSVFLNLQKSISEYFTQSFYVHETLESSRIHFWQETTTTKVPSVSISHAPRATVMLRAAPHHRRRLHHHVCELDSRIITISSPLHALKNHKRR